MKSNAFSYYRGNQILSRQEQPCVLSDCNLQFHVNIETGNHVFKKTRNYNGEM